MWQYVASWAVCEVLGQEFILNVTNNASEKLTSFINPVSRSSSWYYINVAFTGCSTVLHSKSIKSQLLVLKLWKRDQFLYDTYE